MSVIPLTAFSNQSFNKHKHFFEFKRKDYHFHVDIQDGKLLFDRRLITFKGAHLPIDLYLKYNQGHFTQSTDLFTYTGFPKGFKLNYHVFIAQDDTNYKYEDKDGLVHIFKLAENSTTLYYDTSGTGLMMRLENGCPIIFDDDCNKQIFDSYGRLYKIIEKIANSVDREITITYLNNTSLVITSIADNYGHTLTFEPYLYLQTFTAIIKYNNYKVFEIYTNTQSHILQSIKRYTSSSQFYSDSFDFDNDGPITIGLASGEVISFTYDDSKVDVLQANYKQHYYCFSYDSTNKTTTVTNARGADTTYSYDQNQLATQISDNNTDLNFLTLNTDVSSLLLKSGSYGFAVNLSSSVNDPFQYTLPMVANPFDRTTVSTGMSNLSIKRNYVFYVQISGDLADGHVSVELRDDVIGRIGIMTFKGKTKAMAIPIGVKDESNRKYYLVIHKSSPNLITINKARILPLLGDFSILCTNFDTGNGVFYYDNTPYYYLPKGYQFYFFNSSMNVIHYSQSYFMTNNDYLANERAFNTLSKFHFWCNDKTVLVDNVFCVGFTTNTDYNFVFLKGNNRIMFDNYSSSYDAIFYKISGNQDNSFSVTEITHKTSSFNNAPTGTYRQEKETKYICDHQTITYFYYDKKGKLLKSSRNDGISSTNSYDGQGNLINETTSHSSNNYSIVKTYEYSSSTDNLLRSESLVGANLASTYYFYDSDNNVSTIERPNSSEIYHAYEAIAKEKLTSITYDGAPSVVQNVTYENGDTNQYSVSDETYEFGYFHGELNCICYNNNNVVTYTFYPHVYNGHYIYDLCTTNYANGVSSTKGYDQFGRLDTYDYLTYAYDEYSNIDEINDVASGQTYYYNHTYDYYDNLVYLYSNYIGLNLSYTYDDFNRIVFGDYNEYNTTLYWFEYEYFDRSGLEKIIKKSTVGVGAPAIITDDYVDCFNRLSNRVINMSNNGVVQDYYYFTNNNQTNEMIQRVYNYTIVNGVFDYSTAYTDQYAYNELGNIVSITRYDSNNVATGVISYVYDDFGRLIRENNPYFNRTYLYTYDVKGNILTKKEYYYSTGTLTSPLVTHSFTYDSPYFPNQLIAFDGESFQYDNIGNPYIYRGHDLTWARGTLLESFAVDSNTVISFSYDGFKNRIRKEIYTNNPNSTTTTYYFYFNGRLIKENRPSNISLIYLYSHAGLVGFTVNRTTYYFYEKNIQQDIVAIRDANNNVVARYIYDAWGNHKVLNPDGSVNTSASFIGNINPYRYRSYYYDTDLKMYWLTTRYYDPEICRFISPDDWSYLDYQKLHGLNLYAYSKNNPVMYYDPSGHFMIGILFLTAILSPLIPIIKTAYSLHEKTVETIEKATPSEDEKTKEKYTSETINGVTYWYRVGIDDLHSEKTTLKVYESWRYSKEEIEQFLKWLSGKHKGLNVLRVKNEWQWHNIAYTLGIKRSSTKDVDPYFNWRDDNPFFAMIFDFLWLG